MPNIPPVPVSRPTLKLLSTEGSVIPGETEEDGLLRREYVLVGDTQAVEFNQAVDGQYATLTSPRHKLSQLSQKSTQLGVDPSLTVVYHRHQPPLMIRNIPPKHLTLDLNRHRV
jgi:hypothetical protein